MAKRIIFASLIIVLSIALFLPSISATASTEISFDSLDLAELEPQKKQQLWQAHEVKEIPLQEVPSSKIVSFDVSEQGNVAVALADQYLLVYNSDFQPINAFQFSITGSYYVFWVDENIALMKSRSSQIIIFSKDGKLIDIFELRTDSVTNNTFSFNISTKTEEDFGKNHYFLEKPDGIIGFLSGYNYDRLICQMQSGEEHIIYSTNSETQSSSTLMTLFFILFMITCPSVIIIGGVIVPAIKRRKAAKVKTE